jgi:MYXO-CTERM domain-containing protein
MKKIVTIAAVVAAAGTAYGQAFSEDFEGGVPAGWGNNDLAGDGVIWDTDVAYGNGNYTNGSGFSLCIDTDEVANGLEVDAELVTHMFTVPSGASLDLTANFQSLTSTDFFDIDIDTGGGWVNLLSWAEDHGAFYDVPGEDISLDLSSYGGSDAKIRFHHYDTNTNDWNWYIEIDDVAVTPAPSVMALLGLGGLVATRRRR